MKLKKTISLLLTVVFILSIAACSESSEPASSDSQSTVESSETAITGNSSQESETTESEAVSSQIEITPTRGFTKATVVQSYYLLDRVVVAEVCATAKKFGADPIGKKDSTSAIQKAIDYCADTLGGGVVYLPAGNYRINGTITMRPGTTLLGDYVDPDKAEGTDYGTMLWVYTDKRYDDKTPVILMAEGSAVDGLTFYYPKQSVKSVKDYYYTIAGNGAASGKTIININLLNSYCGIISEANTEKNTVRNVKGTVLKTGLRMNSTSDICLYSDLSFSPVYWAKMDGSFSPPAEDKIRSTLKSQQAIGIQVRDLDRDNFRNITLDGYYYGFYGDVPTRNHWSGTVYNADIKNGEYGIFTASVSSAYGVNISESKISGKTQAILNNGSGTLCLNNTVLSGNTSGSIKTLTTSGVEKYTDKHPNTPLPKKNDLFNLKDYKADNTGKKDATAALQKALDAAKENGGGVVYVPGGIYRIDGSVTVPAGTVLMGSSYYPILTPGGGSTFYIYGKNATPFKVEGEGSGLTGFLMVYPENGYKAGDTSNAAVQYPYTISCTGAKTYVKNITMIGTSKAVSFDKADGFMVDRLLMNVWHSGVKATNSNNGFIYGIHVNANYRWTVCGYDKTLFGDWHTDTYYVIDKVVRNALTLLEFENCKNVKLIEDFHYGSKNFASLKNSSVYAIGCEASRLNGYFFNAKENSTVTGMSFLCYDASRSSVLFLKDSTSKITVNSLKRAGQSAENYTR